MAELVDETGTTVFKGSITNGGSLPSLIEVTVTAAQIIAAWDGDSGAAAIELEDIAETDVVLGWWEYPAPTLDGDAGADQFYAYTSGASTEDVFNSGENFAGVGPKGYAGASWSGGTYIDQTDWSGASYLGDSLNLLKAGASAYMLYTGSTPPTEGESKLTIAVLRAAT